MNDLDDQYDSLLDAVRGIGKPVPEPKRKGPTASKADVEYVSPTAREIEALYAELVALGEIDPPRGFVFPGGASKKKLLEALEDVDPHDRIAERATLLRLLRAKKTKVPDGAATADLVQLAMASGCFGRVNKKRVT